MPFLFNETPVHAAEPCLPYCDINLGYALHLYASATMAWVFFFRVLHFCS